jgi:uncharacterized protein YndB with AHSA1/START domain
MPSDNRAAVAQGAQEGQTLEITRTFNAPRERVFQAFAEAERLARWWGPKGCSVHVARLDFRPGGDFHYRMDWPEGPSMWGRFVYREIVAPERLVWVNTFSDPDGNLVRAPFDVVLPLEILNTVTLTERDGRTVLHLRSVALNATAEEQAGFEGLFDSLREGWGGTWDQLDAYLATADGRS